MRGSPLVSLALVCVALFLAWVPLQKLIGGGSEKESLNAEVEDSTTAPLDESLPARLRLSFSSRPERLELKTLDSNWVQLADLEELDVERELDVKLPPEGIEVFVEGSWPRGTERAAVRISLAPEGMEEKTVTAWSEGERLSQVVELHWEETR